MRYLTLIFTISYAIASTATLPTSQFKDGQSGYLLLPDKTPIQITKVMTSAMSRARGLSGVKAKDFKDNQGALFIFNEKGLRTFWMPNTFFDLDIVYLDQNFKVTDIERNLKHHPTRQEPVPRARPVIAWHALEIKARTELSKKIKVGMKLTWKSQLP